MKKYAYANVKIPLEVLSNGNFELLKEHIQVEFTHCKELPPKQELNIDFSSILNELFTPLKNSNGYKEDKINMNEENEREIKIKNVVEEQEPQNEDENEPQKEPEHEQTPETETAQEIEKMIILSSEIKKYKHANKNTSFKNRKNSYNYTNK